MTFAERLRELRIREKLTQRELGEKLKLGESTISMYEAGKREPSFDILDELSDYFNVDIDYLLGKSDYTTRLLNQNDLDSLYGNHKDNLSYFADKPDLLELYKQINESQSLQLLFDNVKDLTPQDLELVLNIIKQIRKDRGLD